MVFLNPFLPLEEQQKLIDQDQLKTIESLRFVYSTDHQNLSITKSVTGLTNYYFFDLASLFPVLALDLNAGDVVLDMCAAPGGKSLMLISKLQESGPDWAITLNERSNDRFMRLKRTINDFIPEKLQTKIRFAHQDAKNFGINPSFKQCFDKILIDAPCSSERHVLQDEKELNNWSEKRVKNLSMDQFTLICSGFDSLKAGGTLVYSTCAINRKENDENIKRLFDKRKNQFQIINYYNEKGLVGEPTEFGIQYLPDRSGFGPIYFAVIKKN